MITKRERDKPYKIPNCGVCSSTNLEVSGTKCINNLTHEIETPFNLCNNCGSLSVKETQEQHDLLEISNRNYEKDNKIKGLLKSILIKRELMSAGICGGDSLDYGCGNGALGHSFNKLFPASKISFVDLSTTPPKGISGRYLSNEEFIRSSLTFDNIFLRHVLEHSGEPQALLERLAKRLRPKGKIYVWIPNESSAWKIFGARWPGYFYPFHQYVISHTGIKHIANSTNRLRITKLEFVETPIFGVLISSFAKIPRPLIFVIGALGYVFQVALTFLTPQYRESMLVIFEKDE